jgi:acyl carrier protein
MRIMNETSETFARLQKIFQDVFLDDGLTISAETNSNDFEGWDSLTHVTLMVHVERVFDIQFTSSEIASWKNVGELEQLIEARVRQKG